MTRKERNATVNKKERNANQLYAKHTQIRLVSFQKNVNIKIVFPTYSVSGRTFTPTMAFITFQFIEELNRPGFIRQLIITFFYAP
jgi:hypothetical protein